MMRLDAGRSTKTNRETDALNAGLRNREVTEKWRDACAPFFITDESGARW